MDFVLGLISQRTQRSQLLSLEISISKFESLLGSSNVSTSTAVREHHGKDEGPYKSYPPDVVVWVSSTDQVSAVTRICSEFQIPIIPFGSGTGMELGVGAPFGGVCMNLSNMDKIIEVHPEDFDASVEAGVTRLTLNNYIRDTGLWFPVDPGADASLGGMSSTRASGTNAVRYGTMKDNVLNMEVVLADGRVIHTAGKNRRARKSSAGYNLTNLFVGSEGTLGIITKITLKLHAIPETIVSAVCPFLTVKAAVDVTTQVLQSSIPVARIELMDEVSMYACNLYSKLNYKELPTLFLEFHGSPSEVETQAQLVEEISKASGGLDFQWASDVETRNKLWKARHEIYYAGLALNPGYKFIVTDACVPISKLSEVVIQCKQDIDKSGLTGIMLGHVGDGNFHCLVAYPPFEDSAFEEAVSLKNKITLKALDVGGTCTGEHGIGMFRTEFLEKEFGHDGIWTMQQIKRALDPLNILNPGKVVLLPGMHQNLK
ncbi:putative D-lactate dehydrogenase, mitochondrial isoform X2 [Tachypleus tridentatus]|uniref:putative D-lactate dehydrogenase, mitochondrial isoform X2 n=1 Tax=Tachypleus tridentatus TaxID=6853 RepID=UPI003FD55A1F